MRALATVVTVSLLAPACGPSQLEAVSLARLVADQESYVGRDVRTEGVVRRFTDQSGPYFVLEDAEHNRVELVPAPRVAAYQGRRIDVDGVFGFKPTRGRFIEVGNMSIVAG
jgi:hypothetical protein